MPPKLPTNSWINPPEELEAIAIDALRPEWVVIENVPGLFSAPAVRTTSEGPTDDQRNPNFATFGGDATTQAFARWKPTRGIWGANQPDLFGRWTLSRPGVSGAVDRRLGPRRVGTSADGRRKMSDQRRLLVRFVGKKTITSSTNQRRFSWVSRHGWPCSRWHRRV